MSNVSKNVNSSLKNNLCQFGIPLILHWRSTHGQFFVRIFQNALFCSNYLIATKVTSNYICSSIEPKLEPLSEHCFTAILWFARGGISFTYEFSGARLLPSRSRFSFVFDRITRLLWHCVWLCMGCVKLNPENWESCWKSQFDNYQCHGSGQ